MIYPHIHSPNALNRRLDQTEPRSQAWSGPPTWLAEAQLRRPSAVDSWGDASTGIRFNSNPVTLMWAVGVASGILTAVPNTHSSFYVFVYQCMQVIPIKYTLIKMAYFKYNRKQSFVGWWTDVSICFSHGPHYSMNGHYGKKKFLFK